VTVPPGERYNISFQPAARRAVSERLPESVAAAVLEFGEAALAVNPQRAGKPLFGPLAGCHGARRIRTASTGQAATTTTGSLPRTSWAYPTMTPSWPASPGC
jgi:hypothetical protein